MLTTTEFWLLDIAVRHIPAVYQVADTPSNIAVRWNVVPHNHNVEEIVNILLMLKNDDNIDFVDDSMTRLRVGREDLIAASKPSVGKTHTDTYYRLTARGSSLWEKHAHPNWERFYEDTYVDGNTPDDTILVLSAATEIRLRELFEFFTYAAFDTKANFDQLQIEKISPWRPTYWKTIVNGVRLRCNITDKASFDDEFAESRKSLFENGRARAIKVWRRFGISLNESEYLYPGLL